MFGRRKSSEGFEWHKYVRTTIKLKREQRRQRLVEARRVAAQRAGEAGVALAAGSRAAGAAAVEGAAGWVGCHRPGLTGLVERGCDVRRHRLAPADDFAAARDHPAGTSQRRRPGRDCGCYCFEFGSRAL